MDSTYDALKGKRKSVPPTSKLVVGHSDGAGHIVKEILGQSVRAASYVTDHDHLRWKYHADAGNLPPKLLPAVSNFDALLTRIKKNVPKEFRRPYYDQVGKSLYLALDDGDPDNIDMHFSDIKRQLQEIIKAPVLYALAGAGLSFILVFGCFLTYRYCSDPLLSEYSQYIGMGALGSMLSLLQRSREVWPFSSSGSVWVIVQGATRPFIGGVIAIGLALLVKANLMMGSLVTTPYTLLAMSFFVGLSERIIPEISKNIERVMVNS
ncbi:hypothetical protein ACFOOP_14870 [Marinicaulis aureus]|uniref:Uncharacterized protein n=1 Tax=Hyphococcus aureus TaxID=2666033 RepID=A0ABW1L327_9PROT